MGKLYEFSTAIQRHIEREGLDVFKTRGALAMECGFLITLIEENDEDDPQKIDALQRAAGTVLGLTL